MQVFRSLESVEGALTGCAVAIGNLDGVHLGHQALLRRAREIAERRGVTPAVLTFEPHPVRVLRPKLAPPLLTPLPRKLELLEDMGVGAVVVQPFDLEYAATPAREFVSRDLGARFGCGDVVVGHDFTAGHERARVDELRALLAGHGIRLHVIEPVTADGLVVSSTKIREFLLEGQVEAAAELLTRPHDVDGVVGRGAGRGRGLGFATANVETSALLPANGVYAVRARIGGGGGAWYGGVCNVGVKPTFEIAAGVTAEAHLLDFGGQDLYGEQIRVRCAQIADDAERARDLLSRGKIS
jgi:riboflavin kinase/FMN adenylyltransferase